MAQRRTTDHLSAICLPLDADAWLEDLAPNNGGDGSLYSEAGPRPGRTVADDPLSVMRPVLSGAQSADMILETLVGGHASLDTSGAVQVGYRFEGEAGSLTRGWSPPNWIQGWSSVVWTSDIGDLYRHCIAVVPTTQAICVTYRDSLSSPTPRYATTIYEYEPIYGLGTVEWSTPVEISSASSGGDVLVAAPTGRLLATAKNKAYRSDDQGLTWTTHANGVWPSTHDPDNYVRAAAAMGSDGIILGFAVGTGGTPDILQVASSDGLATWDVVHEEAAEGELVSVVALPTGGFLVAYMRTSGASDEVIVARLAHAYERWTEADIVVALAAGVTDLSITADPDGLIWMHYSPDPADGTIEVLVSTDRGITWTALNEGALKGLSTADSGIGNYISASREGSVILVGNPLPSTNADVSGSLVALTLGGWSTLPSTSPGWDDLRDWTARSGHGPGGGSSAVWLPGDLPGNNGWTATGAAGQTFLTDGRLRILTSGGDARSYSRTGIVSQNPATVIAELTCPSGGDVANNDIAIDRYVSWSGHEFRVIVRFSETQIRVRDGSAGTTLATVAYTCDETFQIMILVSVTSVNSGVWVRRAWEPWTEVWSGDLTDNTATPTTTGGLKWGNIANSSGVMSVWSFVADGANSSIGNGVGATPAVGRPLTSVPIPLPAETGRAWLAATSGPGALGESYTVPVAHDYPVEALFPSESPSPAVQWRSLDTTEQIVAWDHSRRTMHGDSIALVCKNANFTEAILGYHDGSNWQECGTLDLAIGFRDLTADLVGNVVTPASGTTAGARYIAEGELADGGKVDFIASESSRRVKWNTAGWWGGTGVQTRIILEDIDGTEDESLGVNLVWGSGVLVCHTAALQVRSKWRIRIPADQHVTFDPAASTQYYSAGILVPMALRLFGRSSDYGWSSELLPNAVTTTSRRGTTRVRRQGPPIRVWSMSWTDGVDLFDLRGTGGDWLSPDEHDRGTAWQDVPWLLEGHLTLSGSGETPCVGLRVVPADGETLTDPSLWIYGRVTSSVRQDQVAGVEGRNEVVRTGDLVLREII